MKAKLVSVSCVFQTSITIFYAQMILMFLNIFEYLRSIENFLPEIVFYVINFHLVWKNFQTIIYSRIVELYKLHATIYIKLPKFWTFDFTFYFP